MPLTFSYSVFGIDILSDIDFGFGIPGASAPDTYVRFGEVPDRLEGLVSGGLLYQATAKYFLLKLDGVARYLVSHGKQITVDLAPGACADTVRMFLLGSPMAALLHQRGVLPLHASAIITAKGAVVFAGAQGSGKSTLAAEFHSRGYPVLADELCAVTCGEVPKVFPSFPSLMLWADTVRQLGLTPGQLNQERPGIQKYILPLKNGVYPAPVELNRVYFFDSTTAGCPGLIPISGLGKIRTLCAATYRLDLFRGMNISRQHFAQIMSVATTTLITSVSRPPKISRIRELADLIEKDFSQ